MMSFKEAWKRWSFKAAVIIALLNIAVAVLVYFEPVLPSFAFALLNAVLVGGIAILRVWPQKSLTSL
ncbi:hypothetical protein [Enterovibrio sp. 27052020O]|uniref:DUF7940 domain-containing protein n=1 Tax=Enterovibrio sp. 27052020O TaxID=3241166 RepID=UPI00388D4799